MTDIHTIPYSLAIRRFVRRETWTNAGHTVEVGLAELKDGERDYVILAVDGEPVQ